MIIRRRHTANFTTIGNVLFEDERLAADEVGILAYLLSRPHDWEVRRPALMRRWRLGREAIKRVITNLMRYGWCQAQRTRQSDGTYFVVYEIRDEPGPELSEHQIRRAFSPESGEATTDDGDGTGSAPCTDALHGPEPCVHPDTGYPSLADPSPGDPYVADKILQNTELPRKDSTQKHEREGPIGYDRKARFIAAFEARWPTAATDDRARTARAARDLPDADEDAALSGVDPFLAKCKRDGRTKVPAGWRYLEQKPWTLIEPSKQAASPLAPLAPNSVEAKAVRVAYEIARTTAALNGFMKASNGGLWYRREVTPQLRALADAPPASEWPILERNQAGAWNGIIDAYVAVDSRARLKEGDRAPWPWPPRKDGSLCTGPPDTLCTDADLAEL